MLKTVLLVLALAGCSGIDEAGRVEAMSNSGQCLAADAETDRIASQDFGEAAYWHAHIAIHCRKDGATALSYLNLSARYGNKRAQQSLAKLHLPIPSADLKEREGTDCMILAARLVHCE